MHGGEQLAHELRLQQRLAARHCDAAAAIERAIALEFVHQLCDARFAPLAHLPRVGIVAIRAPHRAALHEHNEPNPRPINRSEGLD